MGQQVAGRRDRPETLRPSLCRRCAVVSCLLMPLLLWMSVWPNPCRAQGKAERVPDGTGLFELTDEQLVARARKLLQKGEPAEAVTFLQLATLKAPKSVDAWFLLGRTHVEDLIPERGVAALETCRKLDPKRPGLHLLLGKGYWRTNRAHEAAQALLRERVISGDSPELAFQLAIVYMGQEKWDQARHELRRLPDSGDPFSGVKHFNLGLLALRAGQQEVGLRAWERAAAEERDTICKKSFADYLTRVNQGRVPGEDMARNILAWRKGVRTGEMPVVASAGRTRVPPEVRARERLDQARRDARARLKSAQAELVKTSARYGALTQERTRRQSALQQAKSSGDAAAIAKAQATFDKVDQQWKRVKTQRLQQVAIMKEQFRKIAECTKKLNEFKKRTGR